MSSTKWAGPQSELLTFATRWVRSGGGPADLIRDRFGMNEKEFFARILDATDHDNTDQDNTGHSITELRRVARQRLWLQRA
ncbi:hypothetical protein [Gordonia hankookensis]|uniref:DUF3263 domain-containing protein n=1 Tax=Gordonia hankookensis TaxID=589403 RepID=A0ABR7WJ24_9ACTN|nr:hypothetical protein [Gordonia hankookensis]MBD1322498.1 hypothetical protein [Gordonia hankookensis]